MVFPEGGELLPTTEVDLPDDGLHGAVDHYIGVIAANETFADRVKLYRELMGPVVVERGGFPSEATPTADLIRERAEFQWSQELEDEPTPPSTSKVLPRRRQRRTKEQVEALVDAHIDDMNQAITDAEAAIAERDSRQPTDFIPRVSAPGEGLDLSPELLQELYVRQSPVGGEIDNDPTRYDLRPASPPAAAAQVIIRKV